MTKPWDLHEATIKKLYAEHTLAVVRKIMIEKYNFKASTRAYRGRLDKWGVRKYNCRKRSNSGSISAGSPGGSTSGSDTASPTLSRPTVERSHDSAFYSTGGHTRDSEPRVPDMLDRSYHTTSMDGHQANVEHYGINRAVIPPVQQIQYGWNASPTQSLAPPTMFSHADMAGDSGSLYHYPPLSPASPSTYPPAAYEPDRAAHERRQDFPPPGRQYGPIHSGTTYTPMVNYGNATTRGGTFDPVHGQATKPSSKRHGEDAQRRVNTHQKR
ncbi:hypothetical protein F4802DRAFT_408889 [Xylaria palmicola]|nr:hypothetical protein F4802DRAFT_408889 [Xylaria palmicola]